MPDQSLSTRCAPVAPQDKNERDFANPIVSVSLGLPATFQFGGLKRNDPVKKFALRHGDVAVWGGPSRLPRSAGAEGRPPRDRWARAHQPDVPRCALVVTRR